jgi:hypothetical protein
MPEQQITAPAQKRVDGLQSLLHGVFIKVHQNVSAKDHVKAAIGRRRAFLRLAADSYKVRLLEPYG